MALTQNDIDAQFLEAALQQNVVTPLEAETLRSELKRKRQFQKDFSMRKLMVHNGHITHEQATALGGGSPAPSQPTRSATARVEKSTAEITDRSEITGRSTTNRSATGRSTTSARTTAASGPARRKATGRTQTSLTDKIVQPGTIIQSSEMTIAHIRDQMGIEDGVKLVSGKMESSLAHLQPDATVDRKRYVVVREIARGGMGKVLEVEDTELRRSVALKVLRKEMLGRRDVVERFLEEAQITGQLEHPNIVPVHEMGVDGAGNLYFTMKYVEGDVLSEVLLKRREGNRDTLRDYPLMRLLDIFLKICEGIAFAHARGVIHRDLKPANIMVGTFGEVQIMDWGVAKIVGREHHYRDEGKGVLTDRLDASVMATMVGSVIGTPSYMSPEQARGDIKTMGPKSDIFSLGVILYEMLAMRSPWTGQNSDEVLEQVREMQPLIPSERNTAAEIPAELERLCMTCLAKDIDARVGSVKELEENIRSYIEGRAMGAVQYSALQLMFKWVKRNKNLVLAVVAVLMAVAGTLVAIDRWQDDERDKIPGLMQQASSQLEGWEDLSAGGKFDEAQKNVEQARAVLKSVISIDETEQDARDELERIGEILTEIRDARRRYETALQIAQNRQRMMEKVPALMKQVSSATTFNEATRILREVLTRCSAVLLNTKDDEGAQIAKAQAAFRFVRLALDKERWDLAEEMLRVAKETGVDKKTYDEFELELRFKRG